MRVARAFGRYLAERFMDGYRRGWARWARYPCVSGHPHTSAGAALACDRDRDRDRDRG